MRGICRLIGAGFSSWRAFVYACVDIYCCAVTPSATGGAPVMMVHMARDGIPYSKSSVCVLINRVAYTVAMVIWVAVSLMLCPTLLLEDHPFFRVCLFLGLSASVLMLILGLLGLYLPRLVCVVCHALVNMGKRLRLLRDAAAWDARVERLMEDYTEASGVLRQRPAIMLRALLLNLGQRAAAYTVAYVAYRALGFSGVAFIDLFALQAVSCVAVYVIPTPGTVGASEAMYYILYDRVFGNEDERVAAILLTRGITYFFQLIFCGATMLLYHVRCNQSKRSG